MPLLLSLYLPLLPLETLRRSWSEPAAHAVMDGGEVLIASPLAMESGVRPGMRTGGVATIAPGTIMLERDVEKEARALDAVALALLQFTPNVAFDADFSMMLDVGASLRLFGGPVALCRLVRHSVQRLGFTAVLGGAPTAHGAWLLAHAPYEHARSPRRRCLQLRTLTSRLDRLPCAIEPAAHPFMAWLDGIGARQLGALRRLPRAGLQRRTGKQLLATLDHAYGDLQEMHRWITVPDVFSAHAETFDRIEHAEALLVGATALILQMVGWLMARHLAVLTFTLLLEHERGRAAIAPTPMEITLAEPAWREPHLLRLLKERLAKLELAAPVIGLTLQANQVQPMQPPTDQLFPEPGGSPADFKRLLELLSSRLGPENVLTPTSSPDHRPEQCNGWGPATRAMKHSADEDELPDRPCWVLPKPIALIMRDERPFYGSPLRIIRGPERLEAGWWDDQTVVRDYYVAQGTDATCFWIFRTRDARWYLHGLFG
ncbi:DNA polymerase Y family protein [Rugamonas sp. A1-17]|nr:DNA polymerase Y family protein [Rugamonas sp. A1-17]